ncbi:cell wall-binding repeat-containing protein [Agromyces aerolatus]|uniref:cell wall-binding repeat-containing protein n=1 Tax=Agromyces sp. LY-1074 TaxID=3074080 RepID=UPI002859364C|nr:MULTISPECIES: cell wall-binding repeat-containing protein [unclassified Agromyces]MDR5698881.1 cell wall-binding repeat-containing protein [Agromyces sp. LY-1074]MDR5705341.1 cell wall-binding repeat-containing protein [Agromyces sp. LY-1358]
MRRTTSLLSIVIALGIVGAGGLPALAAEPETPPSVSAPAETARPEHTAQSEEPAQPEPTAPPEASDPPGASESPEPSPAPEASAPPKAPTDADVAPRADARLEAHALVNGSTVINDFPPGIYRLQGINRYATSVAIGSRFQPNVPVVYVATGLDFPDALSSAAAAARLGGPLLLTESNVLTDIVAGEIRRLNPKRIVVAGSEATISKPVFDALGKISPNIRVDRLGGVDRYETAERIIADAFTVADQAYVATGRTFPDALAASAAAGTMSAPVFLVDGQTPTVRAETLALMKKLKIRTIRIVGDIHAVSAAIQQQLTSAGFTVHRDQGQNRFSTAIAINEAVFGGRTSLDSVVIATGEGFADALAGAALAGQLGAPLYLVKRECMSYATSSSMQGLSPGARVYLGSAATVGEEVVRGDICHEWSKPANGRITDVFGPRTPICTPGGCTSSFHRGLDIGTGCWAPIRAAADGAVTTAQPVGTFGNFVRISHGGGMETGYAHLADGGTLVSVGQAVTSGQQIGWSGATGAATGCHLHLELYQNGTQIDPLPYLTARGVAFG